MSTVQALQAGRAHHVAALMAIDEQIVEALSNEIVDAIPHGWRDRVASAVLTSLRVAMTNFGRSPIVEIELSPNLTVELMVTAKLPDQKAAA